MKYIKKKELIEDEIYKANNNSLTFIMKATKDLNNVINIPSYNEFMKSGNFNASHITFINATPEEKHWLNTCIEQDKFITFEGAMKIFVPEYVECTIQYNKSSYKLGKIYKTTSNGQIGKKMGYYQLNKNRFKPSTKKAYDRQFIVKQLETPKDKILEYCHRNNNLIKKVECSEGGVYQLGDKITVFTKDSINKGKLLTIKSFRWNNANTAICVITDVHVKNGISLDKIELYSKPIVKDIFVLPENWHIKITNKNVDFVKRWWYSKNYSRRIFSEYANYGINNNLPYSKYTCPNNSTEITFDQFKKYILNELI